jgi:hypothetical protein
MSASLRPFAALAGIAMLIFAAVLLPAYALFAAQSDAAAQAQQELAALRARIAAHPALQTQLEALAAEENEAGAMLNGTNSALAAAAMQSLVKELVERHSGQLRSAQTLGSSSANGLEKIQVEYELSLPLGSLKSATYELETKAPYLFLDNVEIRPELYATAGAPPNLHVLWTVHGYRRVETP